MSSARDPFGEHDRPRRRAQLNVLGAELTVASESATALKLAVDAFGGLPRLELRVTPPQFRVRLTVTRHRSAWTRGMDPPRPTLAAGNGLLCATVDAGNFAVVDATQGRALVALSPAMLSRAYHARYELVELAVITLASRGQSLVPLHAACVGAAGRGVLLMGASGAGKSTLALHALAADLQLLSEDSAFVCADTLRVTGTPNYLHVSASGMQFLPKGPLLTHIRRSPTISRRSGARKHEVDLRRLPGTLASEPLRLAATIFLSRRAAAPRAALAKLDRRALLTRLRQEQPYAAGLAGWREFEQRIATVPAYELRRTPHPDGAIERLRGLLDGAGAGP